MTNTAIEILCPIDRADWLRLRSADVTASDVAALFGEHDFRTLLELWEIKSGRRQGADAETPSMRRGRFVEEVAVNFFREDRPDWQITHNAADSVYYRDPVHRLGGTPDVIATAPGRGKGVVQIKSVQPHIFRQKWMDEDGNVEVPLWIALQATLEAYLTGSNWAAVAPIVIDHGLEMPLLEIDLIPGVIEAMQARSLAFWEGIASGVQPQADYSRDAKTIARLYADPFDPATTIDLSSDNRVPSLIDRRKELSEAKKAAESEIEIIDTEIKAKMGGAQVATIGQGRKITWKLQNRAAYAVQATSFRVMRYPR